MLWVDTVLYILIAWYIDNINPGDAGVAQPPWFIFMPPTLKKLEGHIAFGLSVCVSVCVLTVEW